MKNIKNFSLGLRLVPHDGVALGNAGGDIEVLTSNGKASFYNESQASTSPLVTESHVATLTNKSMDGGNNTFTNIPSSALPANVVYTSSTQTLTNKTIDSDNNTISNIVNANIKAGAAIARSKIAAGTASQVVTNDGAGALTSLAQLTVPLGGTGAATLTGYVKGAGTSALTASATVPRADVAAGTADHVVINSGAGALSSEATLAQSRGGTAIASYTAGDILYANASATLTKLPLGSAGTVLTAGATIPAWGSPSGTNTVVSKTANYTLQASDNIALGNAASATFSLTLPSAVSNSGKLYRVKKTDATFNAITVTDGGSFTTTLNTQDESIDVLSDGAVWSVFDRVVPGVSGTYTIAITGSVSNPTKGTVSVDIAYWYRQRNTLVLQYSYAQTGAGSAGSGTYKLSLPVGLTIDTAKLGSLNTTGASVVGSASIVDTTTVFLGLAQVFDSTHLLVRVYDGDALATHVWGSNASGGSLANAVVRTSLTATMPISGWNV